MILKYRDGETETKTILGNLKIPKLEEIFIRVAIVCHCYESSFENFCVIISLWASDEVQTPLTHVL